MQQTNIYLTVNGEQKGPYAMAQIQSMWNNGLITSDALYYDDAAQDWKSINELFKSTESAPDPVTSPAPVTNPKQEVPAIPAWRADTEAAASQGGENKYYDRNGVLVTGQRYVVNDPQGNQSPMRLRI